ncbi:hypothetical protein ACFY7A_18705 [Streptomyces longwoodensis]|uniref:hypothetical protein n=1 Tax=Streptomyces longwoodensis TaxID=68231 RepID=UPI00369079D3
MYAPSHDDSGGGLLDFLASAQTILLGTVAVLAVVLLVAVNWMHRREDRDREREALPNPTPRDDEEG